jgi:hypothetical protein
MTQPTRNPGIAERIQATADHARATTCPRCHAPVLTARAGRIAALDVVADPEPINLTEEILALLQGRLTWHLITEWNRQRITWRHPTDIRAGPARHPVIADHTCPPNLPVQETLL